MRATVSLLNTWPLASWFARAHPVRSPQSWISVFSLSARISNALCALLTAAFG